MPSSSRLAIHHASSASAGFTAWAALAVMLISLLVLVGWGLDMEGLKKIFPGLATMKPLTALGLLMDGASLWLLRQDEGNMLRRRIGQGCAVLVALLGGVVLLEYGANISLDLDLWFFRRSVLADGGLHPGRPAPSTAYCLLLASTALLTLGAKTVRLAPVLALQILLISLLALVGYVFSVSAFYQIKLYASTALHTAVLLLILSLGLLSVRYLGWLSSRLAGSGMARRLLPAAVLFPSAIGLFQLKGQRLGLYDADFAWVLFVTVHIVVFSGLICWAAKLLNRTDAEREARYIDLQESEERFRLLFEASPSSVLMTDLDGHIRLANRQAETLFGYMTGQLPGQKIEMLLRAQTQDRSYRHPEPFAVALQSGVKKGRGEMIGLRRDATEFVAQVDWNPLVTREGNMLLVTLVDITGRKQVEEALRESEERLRLAWKATSDVIWDWDIVHDAQRWSVAGVEVFGWRDAVDAPQTASWGLELMHPDDRLRVTTELRNVLDDPTRDHWEDAYRFIRANGSYAEVFDRGFVIRDGQGKPIRMIGSMQDITERKRAEEKMQEINLALEQQVALRTQELECVNVRLKNELIERESAESQAVASLREKEVLLKEIHHRVKNNLQVIASLLRLQADTLTDPSARDSFLDSQRRVRSMALAHEHLYQSRGLGSIDMAEYISSLVNSIRRSYSQAVSTIGIKVEVAEIELDIEQAVPIGLIISELVANSFKHAFTSPPADSAGELWIKLTNEGVAGLSLEVGDNGQGMPDSVDVAKPLSMGLHLVQSFVMQLNGQLTVQCRPSTVFSIFIPKKKNSHV
jgi:PAS domain S-box-containing protein